MLYVSCCGLSGSRDRRTGVCQIFIARIALPFGYPLSKPACGLGALRLLAGLPTRITSRECLRIKIEQVEIAIRPLDDTPTTESSKLDSGGRCAKRRSLLQSIWPSASETSTQGSIVTAIMPQPDTFRSLKDRRPHAVSATRDGHLDSKGSAVRFSR